MNSLLVFVVCLISIESAYSLDCIPCDRSKCRPAPTNCKGGLVRDICNCCDTCARVSGEKCGGLWNMHGRCDQGLVCKYPEEKVDINMKIGRCVGKNDDDDSKKGCKHIGFCKRLCSYGFLPPKEGSCIACACREKPREENESCGGKYNFDGHCARGLRCVNNKCKKTGECKFIAACRKRCRYGFLPPKKGTCLTCTCRPKPNKENEACGGQYHMKGFCGQELKCVDNVCKKVTKDDEPSPRECKYIAACKKGCRYGFLPPKEGSCITCSCRKEPKQLNEECGDQYHMKGICDEGLTCVRNVCRKMMRCPPVCLIMCEHGNVLDENGCPTCRCKGSKEE